MELGRQVLTKLIIGAYLIARSIGMPVYHSIGGSILNFVRENKPVSTGNGGYWLDDRNTLKEN